MKFVLFCEGETERKVLPDFIRRWLDPRLENRAGIDAVKFEGWHDLYKEVGKKARIRLRDADVIAVISLLDLHGPTIHPNHLSSPDERYK